MRYVYLDQNYIIDHLNPEKSGQELDQLAQMVKSGEISVVVSAWNVYEFTKAKNDVERRETTAAVAALKPHYFADNGTLKQAELISFLSQYGDTTYAVSTRDPLLSSIAQMWASYGGPLEDISESLTSCVEKIYMEERAERGIRAAVDAAPALVRGAREAAAAGAFKATDPLFDAEWFKALLPERGRNNRFITKQQRAALASLAMEHLSELYAACPMLWLEDQLYRFRIFDNVRVDANDSVDAQHVIGPFIHCDYFLTRDRKIRRFREWVKDDSRVKAKLIERINGAVSAGA
ncbi:hypothetical protein J2777_003297 [Paraburkholderia graminis]|uniref:hypothetical protein n=1 Tax=Paraburkholderia graminis TaxID=60548 RepID=UPI0028618518|nr:hypothetical protein [Paraburkholderia graminis]MDR6469569.1 hypothetical protein [Paraburkholderia graminis]